MTSETLCLSGCIGGTDHDAQRTYVIHAEGCPNAPKPAEPPALTWIYPEGRAIVPHGTYTLVFEANVVKAVRYEPKNGGEVQLLSVGGNESGGRVAWVHHISRPPQDAEPQSEPTLKWNSEGLAEAPGMRYCMMYGSMFLYIDGKSQGVIISNASDEESRRKAAEEDFRFRTMTPQSEPPMTFVEARECLGRFNNSHWNNPGPHARYSIPARPEDDDVRMAEFIDYAECLKAERDKEKRLKEEARKRLDGIVEENFRNYDALKAERDALKAENAELRGTIDRLLECCGDIQLKRAILAARKEQEASNGKS